MKKIGKVEITTIFWNDWDIFLLLLFEPSPGAANDDISDQIILLLKHSHPGFNGLSCLVSGLQRSPSCIYLWGELACLQKIQHHHHGHLCMSIALEVLSWDRPGSFEFDVDHLWMGSITQERLAGQIGENFTNRGSVLQVKKLLIFHSFIHFFPYFFAF